MAKKYKRYVTIGRAADGKRIRKFFYGDSASELERNIRNYWIEASKVSNPSAVSFQDYSSKWLETYKSGKSPRTYEFYQNALSPLKKFNAFELRKITKSDCQALINEYWDRPRAAQYIRLTLRQIFNCAIDDGIIVVNPARNLEMPKRKIAEKRKLTKAELAAARSAELPDMERMFVNIMLVFGLRPGEALALQKCNFDLSKKILTVDKAVTHVGNRAILKETKTEVVREIPIPDQLLPKLKKYFENHKNVFLFTSSDGSLMTQSIYRTLYKHIFETMNVELGGNKDVDMLHGMTMYTFRHNRATELYYLCQKGVISTKKAAELMGHSEMIFLQVYSHVDESKEKTEDIYKDLVL